MSSATSSCPHCGKTVLDTDKFCIFCGKPLKKIKFSENKGPSIGFGDSDIPEAESSKKESKETNKNEALTSEISEDSHQEVSEKENEKGKAKND